MAELADALVLGTSSTECGFESLRPHQVFKVSLAICQGVVVTLYLLFRRNIAVETDSI